VLCGFTSNCLKGSSIVGFDIDRSALERAQETVSEMAESDCGPFERIDFVQSDISTLLTESDDDFLADRFRKAAKFDTVIMNPPFGTRKSGIDMVFLKAALQVCWLFFMKLGALLDMTAQSARYSVYSLHKTSTRKVWLDPVPDPFLTEFFSTFSGKRSNGVSK
jgi:predicted RNA methylase